MVAGAEVRSSKKENNFNCREQDKTSIEHALEHCIKV